MRMGALQVCRWKRSPAELTASASYGGQLRRAAIGDAAPQSYAATPVSSPQPALKGLRRGTSAWVYARRAGAGRKPLRSVRRIRALLYALPRLPADVAVSAHLYLAVARIKRKAGNGGYPRSRFYITKLCKLAPGRRVAPSPRHTRVQDPSAPSMGLPTSEIFHLLLSSLAA